MIGAPRADGGGARTPIMIPWEHLGVATVPGGEVSLRLMRHDGDYSIMVGTNELMSTRRSGSEVALADLTCAKLTLKTAPRVLIGGLGMGFTLRAALAALGPHAVVTVVELIPEVVAWAHGPMASVHGESLTDPRVRIVVADVGAVIAAASGSFDAILLDVDNGPEGLIRPENDALYEAPALRRTREALAPDGVLAVWSSAPHDAFAKRLGPAGFDVEEHKVRANGRRRGARHVIWLATRR